MGISKSDLAQFKKLVTKAKRISARIATQRDQLRDVISDMEAIASNADESVGEIATGIRCLESAADTLSQYL